MSVKQLILKNKSLFSILKTIKNCRDMDFCDQIIDINKHPLSITVKSLGDLNPEKPIYYCNLLQFKNAGFCATMLYCLRNLYVAYLFNLYAVIKWHAAMYIDSSSQYGDNPFLYFFEQPSNINEKDVLHSDCVIFSRDVDGTMWDGLREYEQNDLTVDFYGKIYKRYMFLNQTTTDKFKLDGVFKLKEQPTIGVHVRGTDFNAGWKNHPLPVTPEQYLDATLKLMQETGTERVFLATDDINALNLFVDKLGDKLIYYADTNRTTGNDGVHTQESDEPGHKYRLGYEILRDVYSLAYCDYLVAGLSNVGHVARIIAHSMDKDFKKCVILSEGIKK